MFQVLNKVTGGKPRATRRSSGGRQVILKALNTHYIIVLFVETPRKFITATLTYNHATNATYNHYLFNTH